MKTNSSLTRIAFVLLAGLVTRTALRAAEPVTNEIGKPLVTAAAAQDLSSQATDPTASLMAFNFKGLWSDFHGRDVPGERNERWEAVFQPVIPFAAFGKPNIFRATIPYQLGGRGDEGFKQISLFDLVVFNEKWGRWGVGPVMSLDTTGDAPDRFVIGPAIGGVWRVNQKFNLGLFNQNVFGGDTASSQLQPVIAYQLGHGWALSAGDAQFTYDWKSEKWVNVPMGFQLGKVTKIGKLPVRFSINPQYNLMDRDGYSKWNISFTFTALFPSK